MVAIELYVLQSSVHNQKGRRYPPPKSRERKPRSQGLPKRLWERGWARGGIALTSKMAALSEADVASAVSEPDPSTKDFVFQQTMLRVKDPKISLDFYTRILGMRWETVAKYFQRASLDTSCCGFLLYRLTRNNTGQYASTKHWGRKIIMRWNSLEIDDGTCSS